MAKYEKSETVTQSSASAEAEIAAKIVATIGGERLLDLKFWVEPSASTSKEILETALEWVRDAEQANPTDQSQS